MSTSTTLPALAANGESPYGSTPFTVVRLGPPGPQPGTVSFVVPSGDRAVGTVGCLAMDLGKVPEAAKTWLFLRRELYADRSVRVLRTDRLDASDLASGRGRPQLTSRGLQRFEKRGYRGVFPRGLSTVGTMPGTTSSTAFRHDTSSAQMSELYLDRLLGAHAETGTPAVAVVPAGGLRSSWRRANSSRVEEDSALTATLFPDASAVGLLLEATGFPAYGAFLHQKRDRGSASGLLSAHLPEAAPPVAL
ncbi:hypothetical protein AB0D66_02065 [Streptomyces sp. NPDC048270]|uniref:hypothetical protein n=1 Tax=Streptomyces sp. NPDC048270 TaxID=3154615 RepID=UPI0033D8C124